MEAVDYYAVDTEASPNRVDTPVEQAGHNGPEEKNRDWGGELTALVSANAHVIVRCSWMGDAKVTVEEAMVNYSWPPDLTAADEPYLISVVYDLLANRVMDEEEQDEEEVDETEEDPKEHVPEPKTKVEKKQAETPVKVVEAAPEVVREEVRESRIELPPAQPEPPSSANINKGKEGIRPVIHENTATKEPRVMEPDRTGPSTGQKEPQDISSRPAAPNMEEPRPAMTIETEAIVEPVSANPVRPETPMIEDLIPAVEETLVETFENATLKPEEPELEELVLTQEFEDEFSEVPADTTTEEMIAEVMETEIIGAAPEPLAEGTPHVEPIDAELMEEVAVEEGEMGHAADLESPVAWEVIDYEPSPIEIEEAEKTLVRLGAEIEAAAPEAAERIDDILKENIEAIGPESEVAITPDIAQAELEELFVDLFDELEVEWTPELVKAVAKLALRRQVIEEIQKLKKTEIVTATPAGGTREIIKKLPTVLDEMKKSMARAGAIGKSALRLYSFAFTPLPA